MTITSTILTKTAVQTTLNGNYNIEYTVVDKKLNRVQASIEALSVGKNEEQRFLGHIYLEHDNMSCSIPVAKGLMIAPYFADFDDIVTKIRENIATEETV